MITFSALISIVFFSAIAVVLLKIVFRDNNAVLRLDARFLLVCTLLVLLRLFIPVESPITSNIPVYEFYPEVYMYLKEPIFAEAGVEINFLTIFEAVWILGAVIAGIRLLHSYLSIYRKVGNFTRLNDPEVDEIVKKISADYKRKVTFTLVTSDSLYTPFTFGIRKPYIMIPPVTFTREELYFILRHEMLHYYRGDMLIKVLCEGLKAVYWWNPFAYLLGGLVSDMQEINVDFKIIRELPELGQLDYSECLVKVARTREEWKMRSQWVLAFQKESPLAVRKRISLMLNHQEVSKRKTVASVLLSAIILCLVVLCPNVLIFEPYSIPEEDAAGSFGVNDGDLYYLKNTDGTYGLYLDGQYIASVTEVSEDQDVKVYDSADEIR